jgi:hypothetical protein
VEVMPLPRVTAVPPIKRAWTPEPGLDDDESEEKNVLVAPRREKLVLVNAEEARLRKLQQAEALQAQEAAEAATLARELAEQEARDREDAAVHAQREREEQAALLIEPSLENYAKFIGMMEAYEVAAADPKRLMGSSSVLLKQEKFRKTQWPKLAKLQQGLSAAFEDYQAEFKKPFVTATGRNAAVDLKYDVSVRFSSHSITGYGGQGTPSIMPPGSMPATLFRSHSQLAPIMKKMKAVRALKKVQE